MKFAIWRTIKLGTCKTPDEYRTALKKARYRIGDWGNDILGKTSCSQDETKVDLVVLSIKELGFNKGAYYESICAKTLQLGLELCPAEVGPALRLSYKEQPRGEWLHIAMEAITDSDGDPRIFAVIYDSGKLWLDADDGYPEIFWGADDRFVFVPVVVREVPARASASR